MLGVYIINCLYGGCPKNIIFEFRRKIYYKMAKYYLLLMQTVVDKVVFRLEQTSEYRVLINLFYRNISSCLRPRTLIPNLFHCVEFIT
jgi:hypothetical protein